MLLNVLQFFHSFTHSFVTNNFAESLNFWIILFSSSKRFVVTDYAVWTPPFIPLKRSENCGSVACSPWCWFKLVLSVQYQSRPTQAPFTRLKEYSTALHLSLHSYKIVGLVGSFKIDATWRCYTKVTQDIVFIIPCILLPWQNLVPIFPTMKLDRWQWRFGGVLCQ